VGLPGEKDDEFDALPCDPLEPSGTNLLLRPENPVYIRAWKALWGVENGQAAAAAREKKQKELGEKYPAWVLDQLHTQIMFGNRIAMGRGLEPPRFRWVPFDDALMYPLNNANMETTPDRKFFYGREEMLLTRYLKDLGLSALPATLDEYLTKVVTPTLERQKKAGAVAVKFEAAYLRSLDFEPATKTEAAPIYARGGQPDHAAYTKLQDFLFRYIAAEAGRLGMAVHLHTGSGCGGYFDLRGANPTQLESALDDPTLRKTNFVLVHGGPPFTKEMGFLLGKPNVYTDFSEQTFLLSPRVLGENLRYWLELYPEKVLFGTDLYPNTPQIGWEEIGWQANDTGRRALALALTGMMSDGEITRAQALEFARTVLHDNAAKLYGLP
jgi:predicted TIM-barrel fold metal-dependent hydrolase